MAEVELIFFLPGEDNIPFAQELIDFSKRATQFEWSPGRMLDLLNSLNPEDPTTKNVLQELQLK